MNLLDTFSGIGGFSIGLERAGFKTIAFCEIEDYPRKVLAKHWPDVPIARDVTKLTYSDGVLYDDGKEIYRGSIDALCGGFPCQDLSVAGNQKGINAERSGLWSECARLLGEVRPDYAIFENVTALLSGDNGRWFQRVLWDISEVGYDAEWHCIPASSIGAPHQRDRVWILCYPQHTDSDSAGLYREGVNQHRETKPANEQISEPGQVGEVLAYTKCGIIQAQLQRKLSEILQETNKRREADRFGSCYGYIGAEWSVEPSICRVDDGLPDGSYRGRVATGVKNRAHRLKSLGNAVVPQIPELIGRAIIEHTNA